MTRLESLKPDHFRPLFNVLRDHDPTFDSPSYDHATLCFQAMEGWAVIGDGEVVGYAGYTNFIPSLDIIMHCMIHPAWRRRWITREALKTVFGFPFIDLDLHRISGYMVEGVNHEQMAPFLANLGFVQEGYKRMAFRLRGELKNLILVGLLREEFKWL